MVETSKRLRRSAHNLRRILKDGRIAAEDHATYIVQRERPTYRLRHYVPDEERGTPAPHTPVLLVPPLMVATEVYDISSQQSAVRQLLAEGLDVWAVDYGAPENEPGGISRDVEDHVLAIADAIDEVNGVTGRDVHIAGYSQGGMFVYEAVAYVKSQHVASVMTFGTPVDVRLAVSPWIRVLLVERWLRAGYEVVKRPLTMVPALPGWITSAGFRALSLRKELAQAVEFVRVLHDRDLLARREPRRSFITGDGFVAWPGPAFRDFVKDFIVNNRLAEGVVRIGDVDVRLADIRVPVLSFVGRRDEMVKPAGAHAIASAAPNATCYTVEVPAGHFGLVVGRVAATQTWPSAATWIKMVTSGEKLERVFQRVHHFPER